MTGRNVAVVAEKPSVARDIAKVIGATKQGKGYLYGNGWIVTWALGHLVGLAQPHEIDAEWKKWRRETLPMLPRKWQLEIFERTSDQFEVVRRILTSAKVERVVCATDAGREGELIFRYIAETAGCDKPVSRLWISSLTAGAISLGFTKLRDGQELDSLAAAARGRSQADWLVGMNLSRACTLAFSTGRDDLLTIGRVQTPTLNLLVERELSIRDFKPETYSVVQATFNAAAGNEAAKRYKGMWFRGAKPTRTNRRLAGDGDEAKQIVARVAAGRGLISQITQRSRRQPPPLLHDLTELQRHANRLFGFSAKRTLEAAQKLYEQHKLISYPRTDSRYLTRDVASELAPVVKSISVPYIDLLAPGTGDRRLGRRFVNDSKVNDHHAIIPTAGHQTRLSPGSDEGRIYDLICRRLLAAWHEDHRWSTTEVITEVVSDGVDEDAEPVKDRFVGKGVAVENVGWKVIDAIAGKPKTGSAIADSDDESQDLPPGLEKGQSAAVEDAGTEKRTTRAPKRFTEATLLTAMESAGSTLDDEALSAAMKEKGLGTPATRAEIIETLIRRDYVERRKKSLVATVLGIRLISVAHPEACSPALTGEWEAQLRRIERGEAELADFMDDIERFVSRLVTEMMDHTDGARDGDPDQALAPVVEIVSATEPRRQITPVEQLGALLTATFHHAEFRPLQEDVCRAVTEGRDALLVMPTGAGKSLCYQLPGLARAGTTLVISPLIALMEDQVGTLQALGLVAERIHSGRNRSISRKVAARYLEGELDFLFISPERLAVPGFPELLARRPPTLIAIDEAHCISHWGHDFRPDYRMIGERLPLLRPAPVVALTATATPMVQHDILEQLNLPQVTSFIHGFRRTNIAVEVVEAQPSVRRDIAAEVLGDPTRRPAIIYTPTRNEAEELGAALSARFPSAAYHAGMKPAVRDRVQSGFLEGEIEVIVATIAFGMGIDKANVRTVIHTGLPGTVEGYYQEIGRAGRDGLPSRAILLYSWADRRTHEFFFNRDYPETSSLEKVFAVLGQKKLSKADVQAKSKLPLEVFEPALEKLWIHGGAVVDPDESTVRGRPGWRDQYNKQRVHRQDQLERITRFAEGRTCRMLQLVKHFGDRQDSGKPCGMCDICAGESCLATTLRAPTGAESKVLTSVLGMLRDRDGQSTGQLFRAVGEKAGYERRDFEGLLSALARSALVEIEDDSFDKDGRTIRFQRAWLTRTMRLAGSIRTAVERVELAGPVTAVSARKSKGKRAGRKKSSRPTQPVLLEGAGKKLYSALCAWRLEQARRLRIPAFRIMTDRTLKAIAVSQPANESKLLTVSGIGPAKAKEHGSSILALVATSRESEE